MNQWLQNHQLCSQTKKNHHHQVNCLMRFHCLRCLHGPVGEFEPNRTWTTRTKREQKRSGSEPSEARWESLPPCKMSRPELLKIFHTHLMAKNQSRSSKNKECQQTWYLMPLRTIAMSCKASASPISFSSRPAPHKYTEIPWCSPHRCWRQNNGDLGMPTSPRHSTLEMPLDVRYIAHNLQKESQERHHAS